MKQLQYQTTIYLYNDVIFLLTCIISINSRRLGKTSSFNHGKEALIKHKYKVKLKNKNELR